MISKKIAENLSRSSWIRAMFEEGEKLRAKYGNESVFDFSIGNPEFEPPLEVVQAIRDTALSSKEGGHRYMSNAGYESTRKAIAQMLNDTKGSSLEASHVVMTAGAAGGLNAVLKAILDPGSEVIVFSPYFVEYLFYIDNHGGKPVIVPTPAGNFQPDPELVRKHITPATKAIIINNPNNPTGVIYSEDILKKMSIILDDKQKEYGTVIYVISDEPYDRIVYDGAKVPSLFEIFKNSIIVNSFSKSLALPGERIGYIAVNDRAYEPSQLVNALLFCNRTLGFVNAPAFMQKVVEQSLTDGIDVNQYKQRRDMLYNHLVSLGFKCVKPQGAFYLFPQSLIEDDVEFVRTAQKYNLLLVPGKGFGCPGHVRLAYCIDIKTIERSLPAFSKLAAEFSSHG